MPKFIVEAKYEAEAEPVSFGHTFSLDEDEFRVQLLDVGEELFLAKDRLADVTTITAAEDISDDVLSGDVVWRDWGEIDLRTAEKRKEAIQIALGTKALWRDRGFLFDMFSEILCPDKHDVEYYGLTAEDGFVLP